MTNRFAYNPRSELTSATMGTNQYGYAYDPIGNRTAATNNAEALTYLSNALNQYTNILCAPAPLREDIPAYDLDGNLTNYNGWTFAWSGENRLIQASNAQHLVTYAYDYQGRMVAKQISRRGAEAQSWEIEKTSTLIWDGFNIIQTLTHTQTHTLTNAYIWGLDLSQSLQGAGGVGGLLAEVQDGTPYFAAFDANGNVTDYVATNGAIAAHYEYSPFGEIVVQSGDLADAFTHRFSTKPCCAVTGLSEYEFRKYSPELGRWVNRDPIGERGGLNLYVLVGNRPGDEYDLLGLSWPGALAKCGLEALKKVLGDKLGQEIKGARLCEKVADHILANLMADPCQRQSFNLDKPPLTFDVNNWAQVALSCILGQVRSAGGIDKFLEKMDDKSKQKMLEKFMDLGEAKLSDFLKSNTPTISYSISYKCDSKESVGFDLTSHLMIKVDGKVEDLPLAAGDTSEQWRCDINPVAKWSNVFSDFCCGCKTLLDKPQKKE